MEIGLYAKQLVVVGTKKENVVVSQGTKAPWFIYDKKTKYLDREMMGFRGKV